MELRPPSASPEGWWSPRPGPGGCDEVRAGEEPQRASPRLWLAPLVGPDRWLALRGPGAPSGARGCVDPRGRGRKGRTLGPSPQRAPSRAARRSHRPLPHRSLWRRASYQRLAWQRVDGPLFRGRGALSARLRPPNSHPAGAPRLRVRGAAFASSPDSRINARPKVSRTARRELPPVRGGVARAARAHSAPRALWGAILTGGPRRRAREQPRSLAQHFC